MVVFLLQLPGSSNNQSAVMVADTGHIIAKDIVAENNMAVNTVAMEEKSSTMAESIAGMSTGRDTEVVNNTTSIVLVGVVEGLVVCMDCTSFVMELSGNLRFAIAVDINLKVAAHRLSFRSINATGSDGQYILSAKALNALSQNENFRC